MQVIAIIITKIHNYNYNKKKKGKKINPLACQLQPNPTRLQSLPNIPLEENQKWH